MPKNNEKPRETSSASRLWQPPAPNSSSGLEPATAPAAIARENERPKCTSPPSPLALSTAAPGTQAQIDTTGEAQPTNSSLAGVKAKIVKITVAEMPKLSPRREEGNRERTLDEALRCEGMDEAAWARSFKFYLDHASGKLREIDMREAESTAARSTTQNQDDAKKPAIEIDWKAYTDTLKEWARHLERTESPPESEGPMMVQLEHSVPRPFRSLPSAPQPALPGATE